MRQIISKIGDSQGIILDAELMERAHLASGDEVNIEVHEGGIITISAVRKEPSRDEISEAIKGTMTDYARTLGRLG